MGTVRRTYPKGGRILWVTGRRERNMLKRVQHDKVIGLEQGEGNREKEV
jgi:hypothetical protein